ncbi:hypothetical protein SSCG_01135 [Streptomyces clavuligerus]|nr:hypothetical protein SSCG_01135 [Streptomyces clavuligerus]
MVPRRSGGPGGPLTRWSGEKEPRRPVTRRPGARGRRPGRSRRSDDHGGPVAPAAR